MPRRKAARRVSSCSNGWKVKDLTSAGHSVVDGHEKIPMRPIVLVVERKSSARDGPPIESWEGRTIASTQGVAAKGQLVIARGGLLGEWQVVQQIGARVVVEEFVVTRGTAPRGVALTL